MAIQGCNCKELTHIGQVVNTFVQQSSSDDYFMATIWNGTEPVDMQYESTAYGSCIVCNGGGHATIDASPETMAAYKAWMNATEMVTLANDMHYGREIPVTGSAYVVVRGRKVAKGTTGTCRKINQTMYGHLAMLQTVAGMVWVDTKNLAPTA